VVKIFWLLIEVLLMNNFYKDILVGAVFITGLIGFISGEFIISSTLFASSAIASNVNFNGKKRQTKHILCN
jgi:CheY-specific phosphatase CheX